MADALRDQNHVTTLITASSVDGLAVVRNKVNATTHALVVDDASTGSDNGNNDGNATRDENHVPVLLAASSVDGVAIVEVYGDAITGALLIDSN